MKNCHATKLISILLCLVMISLLMVSAIAEELFAKDLTTVTDEELQQAADLIRAEQKARIKAGIILDTTELTIAKGQKQTIKAEFTGLEEGIKPGKFEWSSSDESIVSCKQGKIQGKNAGTAIITCAATLSDGTTLDAQCEVTVYVPVAKVVPSQKSITLTAGDTKKMSVTIQPEEAKNKAVVWESSKPDVVKVDQNGQLSAVKEGKATITVSSTDGSGKKADISVTVKAKGIIGKWVGEKDKNMVLTFKQDGTMVETIYDNRDGKTKTIETHFTFKEKGKNVTITSIYMTLYNDGKASTLYSEYTSHGTVKDDVFSWKTLDTTQVFVRKDN